jgi:CheY-like chemotaxis protein
MSEIDLKNPTVLVVDDNEDSRYLMRLALEARGYRVCEAENGEGDRYCLSRTTNAILMDISMPVLDGLTATARIREQTSCAQSRLLPSLRITKKKCARAHKPLAVPLM